jgi:hypothetical protein
MSLVKAICSASSRRVKTFEDGGHLLGIVFFFLELDVVLISHDILVVAIAVLLVKFHTLNVVWSHYTRYLLIVLEDRESRQLFSVMKESAKVVVSIDEGVAWLSQSCLWILVLWVVIMIIAGSELATNHFGSILQMHVEVMLALGLVIIPIEAKILTFD